MPASSSNMRSLRKVHSYPNAFPAFPASGSNQPPETLVQNFVNDDDDNKNEEIVDTRRATVRRISKQVVDELKLPELMLPKANLSKSKSEATHSFMADSLFEDNDNDEEKIFEPVQPSASTNMQELPAALDGKRLLVESERIST